MGTLPKIITLRIMTKDFYCMISAKTRDCVGVKTIPGGGTSYKWANGDVPLDGVAFSRLD